MKASEWAFDRIKEAFEKVAQDEAEKVSIVEEIVLRKHGLLAAHHRASWRTRRSHNVLRVAALQQPHCNSFFLEDYVWWVSGGKHTKWWCVDIDALFLAA